MGFRAFARRVIHLFRRDEFASGLEEEMRLHIELRARRLAEQGIGGKEALDMARRRFGNRAMALDASSSAWGWNTWERLLQDIRIGARMLRKSPGFTALAILTLAVGLGINTAVFSVVNAVMIRSLPYPHAGRLVALWEESAAREPAVNNSRGARIGGAGGPRRTTVSVANLADYRQRGRSFEGLASYDRTPMNLTGEGRPERVVCESVSGGFFEVLGFAPAMGRGFQPEDDRPGAARVVVLTHDFWQTRLGADPAVLDRSLALDGHPTRIVGVLPAGFRSPSEFALPDAPALFVNAAFPAELLASRGDHEVTVVGRLRPGVADATAQAELDGISAGLAQAYPKSNTGMRAVIAPLRDDLSRNLHDSLWALLSASALIVLVACLNVANLLLVRAAARRRESGVRLALGAGRFRIARQFLAESLMLAVGGCAAAVLLGAALLRVLVALAPANIPQIHEVALDWRVFAVCVGVSSISGLLFGIAPAWQASDMHPAEALKAASRATGGRSQARWRASLTVVEVALSLILLVGAALLLKSFARLMGVDLGFQPDRVLAMNVNLPEPRYGTALQRLDFYERLEERVASLPGVQAVAYANRMPMRGGWGSVVELDTVPGSRYDADFQAVSPGYFRTLGIPLVKGRALTAADRDGAPLTAVVNQAFARQYLDHADPVGHRIRRAGAPWVEIVGVVNDIRRGGKMDTIKPQVYLPAGETALYPVRLADLAVRAAGDPRRLVNAIQEEIWALDKDQPVTNVRTLEEIVSSSVALRRFQTALLALFAAVAVALAAIGIFGVLSYAVSQRMAELGIRVALGARPLDVILLVLRQAGALVAAGLAAGVAGALALTRYLESLLFDVRPTDWQSYAAACAALGVLGLAAALWPAVRGARVDPAAALRGD